MGTRVVVGSFCLRKENLRLRHLQVYVDANCRGDAPAQGKGPANLLADRRKCRYLKVTEMAFPTEPNNINHLVQTTNLGVRSSNLFGRAKFPPSRTKLRTLGIPVEDGRSSNLDRSLAAKGSPWC